jgi:hypothetical protein
MDLMFEWPDRVPLVIQNKVFSPPDERQLLEYKTKVTAKGQSVSLWLLSLGEPTWDASDDGTFNGWHWLSYRQLSERILSSLPRSDTSYAVETMRHYARVVELLSTLVAMVVVKEASDTVNLPQAVQKALADDRLIASHSKFRARSICRRLERELLKQGLSQGTFKSDMTRSLPLIEWFAEIDSTSKVEAGWQLQGGQFRLAIRTKQSLEKSKSLAEVNQRLFDFSYFDDLIGTSESERLPKKGFNSYKPDFVYRYKKIAETVTVTQIEAAAVAIAKKIDAFELR